LKNLSVREKVVIGLLVVLGITYVYTTFFLLPVLKNTSNSRSNITQYNNDLSRMNIIAKTNLKTKESMKALVEKYNSYVQKIPFMGRDPEIVYNFKLLTDKAGVSINNIVIGDPTVGKQGMVLTQKLFVVPVTISINGKSYISIMNFLHLLENDKRVAEVEGISFQSIAGSSNLASTTASANANLNVNYYYLDSNSPQTINYDFNKGVYGKVDIFK
jgi:type IV pilus assembly protein PilO